MLRVAKVIVSILGIASALPRLARASLYFVPPALVISLGAVTTALLWPDAPRPSGGGTTEVRIAGDGPNEYVGETPFACGPDHDRDTVFVRRTGDARVTVYAPADRTARPSGTVPPAEGACDMYGTPRACRYADAACEAAARLSYCTAHVPAGCSPSCSGNGIARCVVNGSELLCGGLGGKCSYTCTSYEHPAVTLLPKQSFTIEPWMQALELVCHGARREWVRW